MALSAKAALIAISAQTHLARLPRKNSHASSLNRAFTMWIKCNRVAVITLVSQMPQKGPANEFVCVSQITGSRFLIWYQIVVSQFGDVFQIVHPISLVPQNTAGISVDHYFSRCVTRSESRDDKATEHAYSNANLRVTFFAQPLNDTVKIAIAQDDFLVSMGLARANRQSQKENPMR